MQYVQYENSDEPVMLLNKHIGDDPDDGPCINAAVFVEELLALDSLGKKRIQIWIDSPGGIVTDGMSIYNAILKTKTKIDTYVTALAASIAAVIFQAGRKRIMADYSLLMYHNAFGGSDSTVELINECIATMIERSGMDRREIVDMMKNETYLTASEAVQCGLADEIERSSDFNQKRFSPEAKNMLPRVMAVMNKKKGVSISKPQTIWNIDVQMAMITAKQKQEPMVSFEHPSVEKYTAEGMMKIIANKHNQL